MSKKVRRKARSGRSASDQSRESAQLKVTYTGIFGIVDQHPKSKNVDVGPILIACPSGCSGGVMPHRPVLAIDARFVSPASQPATLSLLRFEEGTFRSTLLWDLTGCILRWWVRPFGTEARSTSGEGVEIDPKVFEYAVRLDTFSPGARFNPMTLGSLGPDKPLAAVVLLEGDRLEPLETTRNGVLSSSTLKVEKFRNRLEQGADANSEIGTGVVQTLAVPGRFVIAEIIPLASPGTPRYVHLIVPLGHQLEATVSNTPTQTPEKASPLLINHFSAVYDLLAEPPDTKLRFVPQLLLEEIVLLPDFKLESPDCLSHGVVFTEQGIRDVWEDAGMRPVIAVASHDH